MDGPPTRGELFSFSISDTIGWPDLCEICYPLTGISIGATFMDLSFEILAKGNAGMKK
jgi:hypothetical protein